MRIDAAAVKAQLTALEPSADRLPAGPDPGREEQLKAFERNFRALWPTPHPRDYVPTSVERYARSFLGSVRDAGFAAQDVAQDAFVALHEAWFVDVPPQPFPNNDEHFKAIVFSTIRQRALNRRRDESQLKRWLAKIFRERPTRIRRWIFGYPDVHPFLDAVIDASERLPTRTKQAFQMKWRDGYKRHEIAAHMTISVKTVDSHFQDANARLQLLLAEYKPERDENWVVAINRLEELAYPESSANVKARMRETAGDMGPTPLVGVMAKAWKGPKAARTGEPSQYAKADVEQILGQGHRRSALGVIELHRPVMPPGLALFSFVIAAVRALPDLYWFFAREEDLGARWARALTPYLAGDADAESAARIERVLARSPAVVDLIGPLLATWALAPARTRDAEVDAAWSAFQQRVGLSKSEAGNEQRVAAGLANAASMRRDFKVTHERNDLWWARLFGVFLVIAGALMFWMAAQYFLAHGRGPSVSAMGDGGFAFTLGGIGWIYAAQVQVARRSRALLFVLAGGVTAFAMNLFSTWAGWP